jgi:hypothetical protein
MPKLCMITKAIHNATNQLEKLISAKQNHISHDFIQDCERIIGNNNDAGIIINDEDIFHGRFHKIDAFFV